MLDLVEESRCPGFRKSHNDYFNLSISVSQKPVYLRYQSVSDRSEACQLTIDEAGQSLRDKLSPSPPALLSKKSLGPILPLAQFFR